MKILNIHITFFALVLLLCSCKTVGQVDFKAKLKVPFVSFNANHNITKVKIAHFSGKDYIIGNTYEGSIIAMDYLGNILWEESFSGGIMNHEIWVEDINLDGNDEVLAANANGTLYCLSAEGKLLWKFKQNDVPLLSVCVIHQKGEKAPYIATGGNDQNLYYVSNKGELLKTIPSISYKTTVKPNKVWIDDGTLPKNVHTVNFLRPMPQEDGSDILALEGIVSNTDTNREMFYFEPMKPKPFDSHKFRFGPVGDSKVRNIPGVGKNIFILGFSGIKPGNHIGIYNPKTKKIKIFDLNTMKPKNGFGYRVTQIEMIPKGDSFQYFVLMGERVYLIPPSFNPEKTELLMGTYSYNDMVYDAKSNKMILASIQSGGNQIHVLDLNTPNWKKAFEDMKPKGTIANILENSKQFKKELSSFKKPSWEKEPSKVYIMSPPKGEELREKSRQIEKEYPNVKFMGYAYVRGAHEWDRSNIKSKTLREQRDGRRNYSLSKEDVRKQLIKGYNKNGLVTWGGHGVDPFMFGAETIKYTAEAGNGKLSIWIWPELTILHKETFDEALDKLFYPLAEYGKVHNNLKLFIRSKHLFWQSYIYKKDWNRFLSGEFAGVLIPSMEQTLDQTQDLSIAGRLGLWASGVSNGWGTRYARDNPVFMRNRSFSHQNLPNHALRHSIFHISYGSVYVNNFGIKSNHSDYYMSILWELIGTGALYVPKTSEILSFSPVHLSMLNPDERYIREGGSMSASIRYDKDFHPNNPYVFNRVSGEWSGAEVPQWDFSKYASGVKDRRSNFLAPFPNGMVMITPPQSGDHADKNAPRGKLVDHLHPFYKDKLKEFYTDGRYYYSADGREKYNADEYYKVVANEIQKASKLLPINVKGDVAWIAAQTAPKHLRLTLLDKGYLNPKDRVAQIKFNNVNVKKITDIVSGEVIKLNGKTMAKINISAGMFRFLDVELKEEFK
ncbi:hypothetical protein Q4Q34_01645 [Flavivirga abyssicola]|uniref:hypothetical protein n=1 Tax=Flavivirga abyssicola TaxID=3063533 RepID=UPI0026DF0D1D|nr:hypothetical protein [Flavivirga sp. MEBiC07777]WVK13743.1 hypothetical protein Q4Q34_01645 [Flavivirga sp. MEBiC07777]